MRKQIWFDMDGTIADLYGVENWLEKLTNSDPSPYAEAKPLVRMASLARILNRLQREGYEIGVISWLAKYGSVEYNELVIEAKKEWLKIHLKSVKFDHIDIVKYGTPKEMGRNGILFDDEEQNRKNWKDEAYDVNQILEILKAL
jgi:FMN phosphatase YigB (HAD superfamily)